MKFFHIILTLGLIFPTVIHQTNGIELPFAPSWKEIKGCTTASRHGGNGICFWAGPGKLKKFSRFTSRLVFI